MRLRLLLPLLLAAAGTALGAEIPISPPPLIPFYAGVLDGLIFDGSHFLLMYSTIGLEISDRNFGRTFLADDGAQLHAGVAPDYGESGAFASSGHGYLSVAASRGNGYATRLSANGEAIDKRPFLAAPGAT